MEASYKRFREIRDYNIDKCTKEGHNFIKFNDEYVCINCKYKTLIKPEKKLK